MPNHSIYLADSIYKNRKRLKLTQAELAEKAGVTEQTVRKIEHGKGNPQLDVLFSLITELQVDPAEIFYPNEIRDNPARKQLEIILSDCNDAQIDALLPIVDAALKIIKSQSINALK